LGREKQGEAHAPSGFAKDGEHRLAAVQDCISVASFSRSVHGRSACVARVAKEGHPGLARSMDCAAQWIHSGPKDTICFCLPVDAAMSPIVIFCAVVHEWPG
jgi:hypothetical protein